MRRYERREKKLEAKRERIPKHGKNTGTVYRNAIERRAKEDD